MRIRLSLVSIRSLLCMCGVLACVSATAAAEPSVPKCALIDVGQSPLAGIIEARLLERENTEWLERNQVDLLLAEQHLQALFAADATGARAAVGRILKADLLVILRTDEREKPGEREKQKYAELVVAETTGGLRLIARQVPLGEDAEADVETLVTLVDQALAKHREKILAVYAVPPFVSQNLTYEHDYLKTAYARLLEQVFLEQPGVLVVEFAEAESLVREFQLAAPDQRLERRLPVYLLGEYRHEGRADEQTVTVSLRVKSGETVIEEHKQTLPPDKSPAFLRQTAAKLLQAERPDAALVGPAVEARQLAQRGDTFFKLGEWREALSLMEASLLLDPDQPKLRSSAVRAAHRLAADCSRLREESFGERLRLENRALEHFREFALNTDARHMSHEQVLFQIPMVSHLRAYMVGAAVPESLVALYESYNDEKQALAMQLVHRSAEQGEWRLSATFLEFAVAGLEPKQRYAEKLKTILRYQDRPGMEVEAYVHNHRPVQLLNTVENRRFLRQLRNAPEANADVRERADRLLAALDAWLAGQGTRAAASQASSTAASRLTFQPVDLYATDDGGAQRKINELSRQQYGCLPLEGSMDVLWTMKGGAFQIFTIRERDRGRLLWERAGWLQTVVHDGRYLWLSCRHLPRGSQPAMAETEVWVLDPVEEKVWQIGRKHGLPLFRQDELPQRQLFPAPNAVIAAIAPGEAIVAGWIGRTWLAHVVFDPQEQHRVKIFHEARDLPPATSTLVPGSERWKSSTAVFRPSYAFTFSESPEAEKRRQRVAIGRSEPDLSQHPLIIDPSDLTVQVLEPGWPRTFTNRSGFFRDALYCVFPEQRDQLTLFRTGLPDLQPLPVLSDVKEGRVLFDGETVNLIGKEWWRGRLGDGRLESFGTVPWRFASFPWLSPSSPNRPVERGELELLMVSPSHHYGILLYGREHEGRGGLARVVFDGSGMSMDEVLDYHHQASPAAPATSVPPDLPVARPVPESAERLWQTKERIAAAAWSPDGKTIVTAGAAVRAWDAADGRLLADYPVPMSTVTFSPSGRHFATAANYGYSKKAQLMVWSTAEFRPLHQLEDQPLQIDALAFSWDDRWLASGCPNDFVRVWNVRTGAQHLKLGTGTGPNRWLGFTPDDTRLLICRYPLSTQYWELSSGETAGQIESLDSVAGFLPDKRILAVTRNIDNSLLAWDCTDDSSHRLWDRTPGLPVAVSPDGRRVVTILSQQFVEGEVKQVSKMQVWDLATRRELLSHTWPTSSSAPTSYAFSPDGRVLLVTTAWRELGRWELE